MGGPAAYIIIDGPGHDSTTLALREGITSFGRLPSNDVVLLGDLVSRHHARILYFDGRASLQDLGSHNGSWLNGERVTTKPISINDSMRLGNFKVTLHEGEPPEAEAAPTDDATEEIAIPETRDVTMVPQAADPPPTLGELPDSFKTRLPGNSPLAQRLDQLTDGPTSSDSEALVLLFRVTDALARAGDVTGFLQQVLDLLIQRIDLGTGAFYRRIPGEIDPELIIAGGPSLQDGQMPVVSSNVLQWALTKGFTVYSNDIAADLRFNQGQSVEMMAADVRSIVCAPIALGDDVLGTLHVSRSADRPFDDREVDAIEAVARLCAAGIERLELRQQEIEVGMIRESLSRFHAPETVDRILEEARAGRPRSVLEGRTATVVFCDIQGFTDMAERMPAAEVSTFLNEYLARMSGIIFEHHGTISKQLGDGIVAVFGSPYSRGNDAESAVSAALKMRATLDQLVAARPALGPRRLRCGINTGWTLSGATGSPSRMEYTIIGETVNVASRLQATAAPGAIVIGSETEPLVRDRFRTEEVGLQQLPSRRDPIMVFQVVGPRR